MGSIPTRLMEFQQGALRIALSVLITLEHSRISPKT